MSMDRHGAQAVDGTQTRTSTTWSAGVPARNDAVDGTQTRTSTTLLEDVAGGQSEAACAAFVARYGPIVVAIAAACGLSPEDREDVKQEVMMAAIETLRKERYDRQQGRFKAWLKGIIYHKIEHARRAARTRIPLALDAPGWCQGSRSDTGENPVSPIERRRTARSPIGNRKLEVDNLPDPHPGPLDELEAAFEAEWQKVAMEEALDEVRREVDPVTFQAFDLYARKDQPPGQVAKLLGLSRNAVYIAKNRVLARLREKLAGSET